MALFGQSYFLSLPERTIRSAAALLGGASLLLTETLLPDVVRESVTYRVTIGDFQRFLITRLAQVQPAELAFQEKMSDAYLSRKVVGGSLEAIGLLTMRFSPVWVFAIASDAAGGSKVFLDRLTGQLKDNELIDRDSEPNSLVELLEAVQIASQASAQAIDTPPLSQDELAVVAGDLSAGYGRMFSSSQPLIDRFDAIWQRMEKIALEQDLSLEEISGAMAANVASLGKTGLAASKTGADLFGEKILDSYGRTLDSIAQEGIGRYLSQSLLPYLEAALGHLDPNKETWTERRLYPNQE
jgi:hypothetical protein